MSAAAARAAALLAVLAHPLRLRALAALAAPDTAVPDAAVPDAAVPDAAASSAAVPALAPGPGPGLTVAGLAVALGVPPAEAGDACARLVAAGAAARAGDRYHARPAALREAADALAAEQPLTGLLAGLPELAGALEHGRLPTVPVTPGPRTARLAELLARHVALTGPVGEDEVNRRLAAVTDDVARARRLLVDTGWLGRDRAGRTYAPARPLPR